MSKIELRNNISEKELKTLRTFIEDHRTWTGSIKSRRSGCMLILIIPLIISITMVCLINFK